MTGEIEVRLTEEFEITVTGAAEGHEADDADTASSAEVLDFRDVAEIEAADPDADPDTDADADPDMADARERAARHEASVASKVHAVRERSHARDLFAQLAALPVGAGAEVEF